MGATLWQEQKGKTLMQIVFASCFLNDAKKKRQQEIRHKRIIMLAVVWGLEYLPFYLLQKRNNNRNRSSSPTTDSTEKIGHTNNKGLLRLSRWIDWLSHFDVTVQYCAGKHISLTNFVFISQFLKISTKRNSQLTAFKNWMSSKIKMETWLWSIF